MKKKVREEYKIKIDEIEVMIRIAEKDDELTYFLVSPIFAPATIAFLKKLRDRLSIETEVSTAEITDSKMTTLLREKFRKKILGIFLGPTIFQRTRFRPTEFIYRPLEFLEKILPKFYEIKTFRNFSLWRYHIAR